MRYGNRNKDRFRPERKASVRKERYHVDEESEEEDEEEEADIDEEEQDRKQRSRAGATDESDLSDLPSVTDADDDDDDLSEAPVDDASDISDAEMAAKLREAGDGESLLGSGESDAEQEDEEEQFIIADALKSDGKTAAALARNSLKRRRSSRTAASDGGDMQDQDDEREAGSLSPETMRLLGLPVVDDELFLEQEGFHSDSEPSFSDFFASEHGDVDDDDDEDDDDELTSFNSSDEDDDISDLEDPLMGEPYLAHVGAALDSAEQSGQQAIDLNAAMEAGAEIARQDIPLLVIEDLDGRLIYARAGDGEAVFGSDGEFEFVDSDEDDEDDDSDMDGFGALERQGAFDQMSEDEGDTTDELPDEDMPFPRLLVGSVDPRGGRTSRRARAMAAQLRKLSPNAAARSGRGQADGALTDDGASVTSATTPASDLEGPFLSYPSAGPSTSAQAGPSNAGSKQHDSSLTLAGKSRLTPVSPSQASQSQQPFAVPATPTAPGVKTVPAMGSFMPSSTKSVHRAVIDGSRQAASPFTSKYFLQRRGLAGKRRPRRSSLPSHDSKRMRRSSLPDFPVGVASEAASSSPEEMRNPAPLPMELDDVVDASMLWRSDESSDNDSEGTTVPGRRSRVQTDGFRHNSNAFSRWRKIPMNAFRDQQQGAGMASSSNASRGRGGDSRHHQNLGNFLLTRVGNNGSSSSRRLVDHSPFRRTGSDNVGSLHMTMGPSSSFAEPSLQSEDRSRSFVVSPVLWPSRGRGRNADAIEDYETASARASPLPSSRPAPSSSGSRKMTKREKRERKAQRAIQRASARADKEQAMAENISGGSVAAPRTPDVESSGASAWLSVEGANGGSHLISPASAMPHLRITDASPRASPAPSDKNAMPPPLTSRSGSISESGNLMQQDNNRSSALPIPQAHTAGPTPPVRAALGEQEDATSASTSSLGTSLPSSTFGPPLASPLFGGLFAPLNMNPHDENELETGGREGEMLLQI